MLSLTEKKRKGLFLFLIVSLIAGLFSCSKPQPEVKEGIWRATLKIQDQLDLPFNFLVQKNAKGYTMEIINASERILVDEINVFGDSIFIRLPVFDSEITGVINNDSIKGNWVNYTRETDHVIPFNAVYGQNFRFEQDEMLKDENFLGKWEVEFSPETDNVYKAIGEFKSEGDKISGTFLTETGDYRYLEGIAEGNKLKLSCFDGSHAYLFEATLEEGDKLEGNFWAGIHWHERWRGKRNPDFELTHPDSLTHLKKGYERLDFVFPNLNNKPVSLVDAQYRNKVIIVQMMGSWCPNCLDETVFLSELYKKYQPQGLEIIALAYEKTADPVKAKEHLERLKTKFDIRYDILITGKTGKGAAAESLPMLSDVHSFPTTIFIDKTGKVRKIYTGFNGPATGVYYDKFVKEATAFIEQLLAE